MNREYFVYAIAAHESHIKFGITVNVNNRLLQLQTYCPADLDVLATVGGLKKKNAFALEWVIHQALARFRRNGEWFHRCPKSLAVVDFMKSKTSDELFRLMAHWAAEEIGYELRKVAPTSRSTYDIGPVGRVRA